jgi:hypothetical protein
MFLYLCSNYVYLLCGGWWFYLKYEFMLLLGVYCRLCVGILILLALFLPFYEEYGACVSDQSELVLYQSQSQSHVATDGQPVSQSWCRAPSGAHDQKLITV